MKINNLKLINFRNYKKLEIDLNEGINLIYGDNASGKTNLVESIVLCSIGKSFRTNEDNSLIRHNQDFARIDLEYQINKKNSIKFVVSKIGKNVEINDIKINRLSKLSGNLLTITFVPEDVTMFKDSPGVRRRFLDISISGLEKDYIDNLLDYKNYLRQRNALLKEENVDLILLETIEERMLESQFVISNYRRNIVSDLEKELKIIFNKINQRENQIQIKYVSDFAAFKPYEEFKKTTREKYLETRENDLKKKNTSIGIHRDDLKIYFNNLDIGEYASQGQNRLMVLSLKLALARLIKEKVKEDPIIILDDVLSELDNSHQDCLIKELKNYEQVFITSAKKEEMENVSKYHVVDNLIIRGN